MIKNLILASVFALGISISPVNAQVLETVDYGDWTLYAYSGNYDYCGLSSYFENGYEMELRMFPDYSMAFLVHTPEYLGSPGDYYGESYVDFGRFGTLFAGDVTVVGDGTTLHVDVGSEFLEYFQRANQMELVFSADIPDMVTSLSGTRRLGDLLPICVEEYFLQ